jgi:hypothetical protein
VTGLDERRPDVRPPDRGAVRYRHHPVEVERSTEPRQKLEDLLGAG